jgi:hypothetical protein
MLKKKKEMKRRRKRIKIKMNRRRKKEIKKIIWCLIWKRLMSSIRQRSLIGIMIPTFSKWNKLNTISRINTLTYSKKMKNISKNL